ncbi:hypothetical protein G9A89_015599 [Geosiphon pyriformis]|nr:hypothetical protein G9A89_015599 [Geosiphon pyriformis]
MSENIAHCSAMWSNVKKLGHIAQEIIAHCLGIEPAPTTPIPKVAESESIGANHLEFTKFLFQHYCQHLGLNQNHISAESAFNFYVNERIAYLLETPVNTKSARKTFYHKLIQNTSLPTNHNFASIITEINKKIEHHTQQRYLITYASKDKKKLQIPTKHKVELSTNLSYHYTLESTINITSADMFTLNPLIEPIIEPIQPPQQSQQLLQQPQQQLQQPNLDPIVYAPIAKLKKFTSEEDNAQIWLNDIEKNNVRALQAISYFLQDTTDLWYQSLVIKPQTFQEFKVAFLGYFSNNNSINCLANTFTTIKQRENEAVTTYLGCFYRNLYQIQAIQADYFTAPQILN